VERTKSGVIMPERMKKTGIGKFGSSFTKIEDNVIVKFDLICC